MIRFVCTIFIFFLLISTTKLEIKAQTISSIDITKNPEVERFIRYYLHINRTFLEESLERYRFFGKIVEDTLEQEGLPRELALLPIIESGYNGDAVSKSKAIGFWQFIPQTAKIWGLKVTEHVDERKDIEKSTIAAAKYLKFLYNYYGNWELALAAYNLGRINLDNIIKKTGIRNFWELSRKGLLRKETREFVPRFFAVVTIVKENKVKLKEFVDLVKFEPPTGVRLADISKWTGISYNLLKTWNPHLKKGIIPSEGANIYVPKELLYVVKIVCEWIRT